MKAVVWYEAKLKQLKPRFVVVSSPLTYPEEDGDDDVGTGAAVPADGDGEVPGEEGEPAEKEGPHHHTQRHEGLVLPPPHSGPHCPPLLRTCSPQLFGRANCLI